MVSPSPNCSQTSHGSSLPAMVIMACFPSVALASVQPSGYQILNVFGLIQYCAAAEPSLKCPFTRPILGFPSEQVKVIWLPEIL